MVLKSCGLSISVFSVSRIPCSELRWGREGEGVILSQSEAGMGLHLPIRDQHLSYVEHPWDDGVRSTFME